MAAGDVLTPGPNAEASTSDAIARIGAIGAVVAQLAETVAMELICSMCLSGLGELFVIAHRCDAVCSAVRIDRVENRLDLC